MTKENEEKFKNMYFKNDEHKSDLFFEKTREVRMDYIIGDSNTKKKEEISKDS